MDWRKRDFEKLLREEFDKRGFYFVSDGIGIMSAPMINGFKTFTAVKRYLHLESEDYKYVAYKNLSVTVDDTWHTKRHNFAACLFIKIGSNKSAEVNPMTELMVFYQGRMYKYVNMCRSFFFRMGYVRSSEELKDAMKEIWQFTEIAVETWQRSVRTLIMENRWPEENYISDIKFLEDE